MNPVNNRISRPLSAFDMTHNLVFSHSYGLPFGKLASTGPGHALLNGWQFSGVSRLITGLPITLAASGDRALTGTG